MTPTIIQRFISIVLFCFIAIHSTHTFAETSASQIKEWTILVYQFEDENERNGQLIEMEKTGSTENINIVVQSQAYMDASFGCDVFLVTYDDEDGFTKSDKHHLYLYKDSHGVFYYIENGPEKQYLEDKSIQEALANESFNQGAIKADPLQNKKLRNTILNITSKRGHTLKWEFDSAVRRIYIQKTTQDDQLTSPIIEEMHNVDMSDYHVLEDFLLWGMKNYPAKHYFVIFQGHGSGWFDDSRWLSDDNQELKRKGRLSIGNNLGNEINNADIGNAMKDVAHIAGRKIDIIGMNSCFQGTIEVANILKDSADLYIASEYMTSYPGATFPYNRLFKKWASHQNAEPKDVGKMLIDAMNDAYKEDPIFNPNDPDAPPEANGPEHGVPNTMSVLDLNQFPFLIQAISHLSKNIQHLDRNAIMKIHAAISNTRHYNEFADGDLLDFINKLKESHIKGIQEEYLTEVTEAVNKTVVANTCSLPMKNSNGMSIWLELNAPVGEYSAKDATHMLYKAYTHLSFNDETRWGNSMLYLFDAMD